MGTGELVGGVSVRNSGDTGPRNVYLLINADGSINVNSTAAATALTVGTNTVVSVGPAQATVLAANTSRKGAVVQNHGSAVLQLHFTNGQAFGAGPVLLQQYQSWNAEQETGVYKGIVYGIRAALTQNAGVVEET